MLCAQCSNALRHYPNAISSSSIFAPLYTCTYSSIPYFPFQISMVLTITELRRPTETIPCQNCTMAKLGRGPITSPATVFDILGSDAQVHTGTSPVQFYDATKWCGHSLHVACRYRHRRASALIWLVLCKFATDEVIRSGVRIHGIEVGFCSYHQV